MCINIQAVTAYHRDRLSANYRFVWPRRFANLSTVLQQHQRRNLKRHIAAKTADTFYPCLPSYFYQYHAVKPHCKAKQSLYTATRFTRFSVLLCTWQSICLNRHKPHCYAICSAFSPAVSLSHETHRLFHRRNLERHTAASGIWSGTLPKKAVTAYHRDRFILFIALFDPAV